MGGQGGGDIYKDAGGGVGGTEKGGGNSHIVMSEQKFHEAWINVDDKIVGDTSLGMKMNIQHGHVVVEVFITLTKGRDYPSHHKGMIWWGVYW